jgi:hypothetical protein
MAVILAIESHDPGTVTMDAEHTKRQQTAHYLSMVSRPPRRRPDAPL